MLTIRAECPLCGDVDLHPEVIQLTIDQAGGTGSYAFICPSCHTEIESAADDRTVRLLVAAGVHPNAVSVHQDERSIPAIQAGEPFSYDDLLDFHFELEEEQSLKGLVEDRRRPPRHA